MQMLMFNEPLTRKVEYT